MLTLLHAAWNANLGIRVATLINVGLLIFALIALPFDHRIILGLNPWIKPIKFDISAIIFLVTIAAMLSALPARWLTQQSIIGSGVAIAMIVENVIISLQSLRGVRSHMNYSTPRDAMLFAVMGIFIALNTVFVAWLLALFCMTPTTLARTRRMGLAPRSRHPPRRKPRRLLHGRQISGPHRRRTRRHTRPSLRELEPQPRRSARRPLLRPARPAAAPA